MNFGECLRSAGTPFLDRRTMALIEYPARPPYFAYKLIRQMVKSCAAQEIGALGFALVSTIVATEDAAGYKRAVTFYDAQLMMILGAENQKKLAAARNKAVAAGWLSYEHGRRGVPGRYFGTIPASATIGDDAPSDEGGDVAWNPTGTHTESERNASGTQREQTGIEVGSKPDRSGHLSSLSLSLSQDPPNPPRGGGEPIDEFNTGRRTRDRYKKIGAGERKDRKSLAAWVASHSEELIPRDHVTFSRIYEAAASPMSELDFYRAVERFARGELS